MMVEVKNGDSKEDILKKIDEVGLKNTEEKKRHLSKFFGILKLDEDPVAMQRRWRDEW